MPKLKRVYPHSFETAVEKEEMELYHKNIALNRECTTAIDKAVTDSNYELYHYDIDSAIKKVCDEYGPKRVEWVLASLLQHHSYDGRYSRENKAWANTIPVPSEQKYFCNTHPTILDDFIKKVRCLPLREHIYKHNAEYARSNNEMDLYRQNSKLNRECAKAIDAAVNGNYDGMHVSRKALSDVLELYGIERIRLVLANTLQEKEYDGRFSRANKEWAAQIKIPDKNPNNVSDFICESHPVKLDEFVSHFRDGNNQNAEQNTPTEIAATETDEGEYLRVLIVEPQMPPRVSQIGNSLEAMQETVGGYIEALGLEENITLFCNEEGKLDGLPLNRSVGDDIICGTFFICGQDDEGRSISLSDEQIEKYSQRFSELERFSFLFNESDLAMPVVGISGLYKYTDTYENEDEEDFEL